MWAADFSELQAPNATLVIEYKSEMVDKLFDRTIEHQVFLRADVKDESLLTDEYECVFLQVRLQKIEMNKAFFFVSKFFDSQKNENSS